VRSQDYVGRYSDVGDHDAGSLKFRAVSHAVAGEHVNALGSYGVSEFHIRRMVAHNKSPGEVEVMFACRDPQKIGYY
jgi:hypothetical protein